MQLHHSSSTKKMNSSRKRSIERLRVKNIGIEYARIKKLLNLKSSSKDSKINILKEALAFLKENIGTISTNSSPEIMDSFSLADLDPYV